MFLMVSFFSDKVHLCEDINRNSGKYGFLDFSTLIEPSDFPYGERGLIVRLISNDHFSINNGDDGLSKYSELDS